MYRNQLRHFAQIRSLIDYVEPEEQMYEFRAIDREAAEELMEEKYAVLGQDENSLLESDEVKQNFNLFFNKV